MTQVLRDHCVRLESYFVTRYVHSVTFTTSQTIWKRRNLIILAVGSYYCTNTFRLTTIDHRHLWLVEKIEQERSMNISCKLRICFLRTNIISMYVLFNQE